jgi:hypothetical protein
MSYLDKILVNTGYRLEELIREGIMSGECVDHSKFGGCLCVDVSGCGIDSDGLHFRCSCDHPIRYAYPVTMRGEVFFFGSSCIKNWTIKCPDCDSLKVFTDCKTNTIDLWYRCESCHGSFIDDRREKQKVERKRKKEEEARLLLEEQQRERKEQQKRMNRQCIDCTMYNIPKTLESYRIRCGSCYKKHMNKTPMD